MTPRVTDPNYSPSFYASIAEGCRRSAEVVVPLVLNRYAKSEESSGSYGLTIVDGLTVVDVGCGQGWWGAEFAARGCDVTGIDGAYVTDRQIPSFVEHDLALPLPEFARRFDIAVCLEVAEHLPESRAESFIADLCALSDTILFSAAIPHQTGAGHVNLQWLSWWAGLFREHGYGVDGQFRFQFWTDPNVEPWYAQNACIITRGAPDVGPLDVVHPLVHEWGR